MKLLVDSSSSLLLSLLLAQLPLFTSAFPAHSRRLHDFDKLANQTKHLLKLTQDLLKEPAFNTEIDHHRFKSLPAMINRPNDLSSLEWNPTLTQLYLDLKSFEHHFEWLKSGPRKPHPIPRLAEITTLMKSLIHTLHRQMQNRNINPRLTAPSPSLPPHPTHMWEVVQSSQELLQQFRLFCDWASRVFLTFKSKTPA